MNRIYNFSAGPATLPLSVLETAQRDLLSLPGVGMSVLEISHRSKVFSEIIESAEARLRKLLAIPDNYHVLFLQGGASLQFAMLVMNFLRTKAAYIDSGAWAKKAWAEAQKMGAAEGVWSGKSEGYKHMPQAQALNALKGYDYLHLTSNETIQGIAFQEDLRISDPNLPVICDASSDIMSRPLDFSAYDMIYAGAQKNMGPSGVTLVILSDRLYQQRKGNLPTMLDYQTFVDSKSLYNTPPVFGIYMLNLMAGWLETQGGLPGIYKRNKQKSSMLYNCLDQSQRFYQGHATPSSRSLMNVTFTLADKSLEADFLKDAEAQHFSGLKGHRSVGGIRASIYNAFPLEGVEALVQFMIAFQKQHS